MKKNTVVKAKRRPALCLVGAALLTMSVFAAAPKSYTWQDIATLFGPLSGRFLLCFTQDNNGALPIDNVSFRRLRVEDGILVSTKTYPKSTWTPATAPMTGYCLADSDLTRYGHYVYEIQACAKGQCGPWVLSTDPNHATVNGKARAWWIYAQAPDPNAPGAPSVTVFQQRS